MSSIARGYNGEDQELMKVDILLDAKGCDVMTVTEDTSVSEAARSLAVNNIGVLVVADAAGRIEGIFSERDIVRGLARVGAGYLDTPVGQSMSRTVITCTRENSVDDVMDMMTGNAIRHLPVVEGEELIGVLSIVDVIHALLARAEFDKDMRKIGVEAHQAAG